MSTRKEYYLSRNYFGSYEIRVQDMATLVRTFYSNYSNKREAKKVLKELSKNNVVHSEVK